MDQTRELASALVASFEAIPYPQPLDAVLVAASGCGHTLKAYRELLEPGASGFPCPVQDVHEFLMERGLKRRFRAA